MPAGPSLAAVFGGIDTPVSLAMVPVLNKEKRIYMGVWAAGTAITRSGAVPNYAFRVSAVDALVDVRLLKFAHQKFGAKKAGLMLINNPWGQGNEKGLQAASKADQGQPFRTEAAIAKITASEAGSRVVDRAIQIHGGYGVTKDLPLERWYREMRIRRIGEVTTETQKMIISRDLLHGRRPQFL